MAFGLEEKELFANCLHKMVPEYWDGSNTGATYKIRLAANFFIVTLPGKAKLSDNTAKDESSH